MATGPKPLKRWAVADHEWLEVTRWGSVNWQEGLVTRNGQQVTYGCFFSTRQGTGIFINVGKTMVFETHAATQSAFGEVKDHFCPKVLKMGFDSIQILHSWDNDAPEVVFCSGRCATQLLTAACPPLKLRTDLNHNLPCKCDNRMAGLNCGQQLYPNCTLPDENQCKTSQQFCNIYPRFHDRLKHTSGRTNSFSLRPI